jgi:hypothetical protein
MSAIDLNTGFRWLLYEIKFLGVVSVRYRAEVIITQACSELYACVRRGDTYYESGLRLCCYVFTQPPFTWGFLAAGLAVLPWFWLAAVRRGEKERKEAGKHA